jgi:Tfp pilus assembly protein PilN
MIKVNLLRDQTARVRRNYVKPKVSRMGLILSAIFVLVAGGMGTWCLYLNNQIQDLTQKRSKLRIEEARLQELKNEIEKFEELKKQRQSRIDVIEKLKEEQSGPVLLLNCLIQSIPHDGDLWLTSVTQKADRIKIIGYTQRTEVIPDFMSNLTTSGIFQSVDLEQIEAQKDASKFSLLCTNLKKQKAE